MFCKMFYKEMQRIQVFEQKTGIDVNGKSFLQNRVPEKRREAAKDLGSSLQQLVSVRTIETPHAAVAGDGAHALILGVFQSTPWASWQQIAAQSLLDYWQARLGRQLLASPEAQDPTQQGPEEIMRC